MMIKGITVKLYEKKKTSVDEFNADVFELVAIEVDDVLVAPSSTDDVTNTTNLYGKRAQYTLAIPKGDAHNWINAEVDFFGKRWKTIGIPLEGIEENIPLKWNKKVMVELYE